MGLCFKEDITFNNGRGQGHTRIYVFNAQFVLSLGIIIVYHCITTQDSKVLLEYVTEQYLPLLSVPIRHAGYIYIQ